ncbi:DUF6968 family protein [Stigmatella ashevillensis]|uniref:DUF6968 family protein n=1 Tax=Stigmatella ashevillensis TaxID=2995309 RepID=UPI00358DD5D4
MPTETRLPRGTQPTGPIMAERRFELTNRPGEYVLVRVRKPIKDSGTGNYRCSVEWVRPEEQELFELWGIDSMQALQLALRAAGELSKTYEGSLRWAGDKGGYLGFPRTYPEHLPKALLRKLEKMIEREISAHTRKLEAAYKRRQRQ